MTNDLNQIREIVKQSTGVDIEPFCPSFLNATMLKRMKEWTCGSFDDYAKILNTSDTERDKLIASLYIHHSEFFRNPLTFAALKYLVLPKLIMRITQLKHKGLRIWSAGCATGQEAYSLAILMKELEIIHQKKFKYRIFASDYDTNQVELACKGVYPEISLHNLTLCRMKKWFEKKGDTFAVVNELKENIDFSVFNLADHHTFSPPSSIYGGFDMIVCSNILLYYSAKTKKRIIYKLMQNLDHEGYLVTDVVERDLILSARFSEVFPQTAIFQKINR